MEFIHPAMWNVALGWHYIEFTRWQHPAMWRHIGILLPVSISTMSRLSPQSTCHSAPVCEILPTT